MAASSAGSTHSVELSTFKSWGKENVIGYEVETINDKHQVTKVWCKLCRRHSKDIQSHPTCKGPARKAMLAYVDGTAYVAKCNVMRHLSGKAHLIAIWAEEGTKSEQRLSEGASLATSLGAHQAKITTSLENTAREAHLFSWKSLMFFVCELQNFVSFKVLLVRKFQSLLTKFLLKRL